ncbi:hypothetical protein E2P81_ATG05058 [Venturia nashicola]|uniref:Uncharacterized protein n=1 Tax=Venturia nashicola TaxID=86259 RepID=A0A4Z1PIX4_9PEZI|nr:hypothetical protein E6O75_ATG05184 [Venturia nashicola]TLD34893.1 hypothetical protein E2P81_ATG05058 [Venturia nashicola]
MDSLRRILGFSPARTCPRFENDEVYPVHMLDNSRICRNYLVFWTLRFDDVLDPEILHTSLARLLDTGSWRKVGGRLRWKEENVKLEIYVPCPFTEARPAVSFSHKTFSIPIHDHPVAKTLPVATDGPSVYDVDPRFKAFAAAENAPDSLDDYLYSDRPMLALHITSFEDATLVGLSYPHVLMDVMGQHSLVKAWSLVVAGAEVPAMLGAREDAICAALDAPAAKKEELMIGPLRLKGLNFVTWLFRMGWDILSDRVVKEKTIFIPRQSMDKLRQKAQGHLPSADGQDKPFISNGDLLTAWLCRNAALSLPRPRPLTVFQILNVRFRLPSLREAPGLFVQNTSALAVPIFPADLARGSLGSIALSHRKQLAEQASEAQVLAYLRFLRDHGNLDTSAQPFLYGPSDSVLINISNWDRADIFKVVDFSGAVVRAGQTKSPGKLAWHNAHIRNDTPPMVLRNVFAIMGEDLDGNYWLGGFMLRPHLAKIEESLREIS